MKRLAAIFVFALAMSAAPSALAAGPFHWDRSLIDPPENSSSHSLRAVSCTTPHFCATVDPSGNAIRSNNPIPNPAAWKVENIDPGHPLLTGISCVPSLCVATDSAGNRLALTNPSNPASAWTAPAGIDTTNLTGISCPAANLCVAVDSLGRVITSINPTGGMGAWTAAQADSSSNILRAVSCPSKTFCAAVDNKGNSVTSTNPTGGTTAWKLHPMIDGTNNLAGISCPSASRCVAIEQPSGFAENILTSTTPTANGAWKARNMEPAGQFFTLFGVSCPSKTLCVVADDNGDIITSTNPTGAAAAWQRTHVDDRYGFYAVSCSTVPLCVAGDQGGFVEIGRLVLPGTVLTGATIKPKLHKASFSFKAKGIASGFQCELKHDKPGAKGKFSKCRSPKGYKNLKPGKYIFQVRAVNASGADKTPAGKRFKI
jgi:hypothetical protein